MIKEKIYLNAVGLKHFAMKRVKDWCNFYALLAPETVHFDSSS